MSKKPITFYVGTNSDPVLAAKAMTGLQAMVRLGERAKKTLQELRTQGYSNRKTHWIKRYQPRNFGLMCNSFPKIVTITRSDIPDYGLIEVNLAPVTKKTRNYQNTSAFQLMITTQVFRENVWEKKTFSIGEFRITKKRGALRLEFPDFRRGTAWKPNSIHITRDLRSIHKDRIAHVLAEHIVGESLEHEPYSAELARQIRTWFVEDRCIDRLNGYLWQFSKDHIFVAKVMNE